VQDLASCIVLAKLPV